MADFSDLEDKRLVQIALKHEIKGVRICWAEVAHQFRRWRANSEKLRLRLKQLKTRHGAKISNFPRRYFTDSTTVVARASCPRTATAIDKSLDERLCREIDALFDEFEGQPVRAARGSDPETPLSPRAASHPAVDPRSLLAEFNRLVDTLQPTSYRQVRSSRSMSDEECYRIVHTMFATVSRKDIHQKTGQMEQNMGEISMAGLTHLASRLGMTDSDVFLDVGAGIGNVLAQLALQSPARSLLGIEMRNAATMRGKDIITAFSEQHQELQHVSMIAGDIRDDAILRRDDVSRCTVLYASNEVFHLSSQVRLESMCCSLPALRLVAVSEKFCPRHERRQNCTNEFCTLWKLREEVDAEVMYRSKPAKFSIYERRHEQ